MFFRQELELVISYPLWGTLYFLVIYWYMDLDFVNLDFLLNTCFVFCSYLPSCCAAVSLHCKILASFSYLNL